jgi:hypothetical protein
MMGIGLSTESSIGLLLSFVSGIWTISLYSLLLRFGHNTINSLLTCLLAVSSGAFVFLFVIPETLSFASLTIVISLLIIINHGKLSNGELQHLLASAILLSMTVTNWAFGLLAMLQTLIWYRLVIVSLASFGLVSLAVSLQSFIFPKTIGPLIGAAAEQRFVGRADGSIFARPINIFCHSVVIPGNVAIRANQTDPQIPVGTSLQAVPIGTSGPIGNLALFVWLSLLSLGFYKISKEASSCVTSRYILICVLFQLILFFAYGFETFLYSPLILPFLLLVFAKGQTVFPRWLGTSLLALLVCLNTINTVIQFPKAEKLLHEIYEQRQLAEEKERSKD